MNILCWNCQGNGNPWTVTGLKGIVSLNIPNLIFLSEIRFTAEEIKGIRRQLGWKNSFAVDCKFVKRRKKKGVSRAGGLCLLWNDDVSVALQTYSESHIDVVIGEPGSPNCWRFTGLYGHPKTEERYQTWNLLRQLSLQGNLPWVVYLEGIRGGEEVKIRLDRFTSSLQCKDLFPASRVKHLDPCKSDHVPILLEVRVHNAKRKKRKRCFKFEEFWLLEDKCREVVERGWEIAKTRALLARFFDAPSSPNAADSLSVDRLLLESKLNDLLNQEHVFWRQRAKVFWLSDGDLNTKFFHQRANNMRKKNLITGLFDDNGQWCTEDDDLERIILNYFGGLSTSSQPQNFQNILEAINDVVTVDDNIALTKEVDHEEVFIALKKMHPSKTPGPDGFSPCFYQSFWELVGSDVVGAIRECLVSEDCLRMINNTFVALITKVKTPLYMSPLRPISLCKVIYKIGSKVLANRLKPLLDSLISPFQSAFVPGRLISDNSLMAFEISHCLKRRSGKKGYCALKLDMSKAYDRVEWCFLEVVMLQMGFGDVGKMDHELCQHGYIFFYFEWGTKRSDYTFSGLETTPSFFFKAESGDCATLRNLLQDYEYSSGQQEEISASLGVMRVEKHDKYLGLPTELSYSKEEAFGFLNEKIRTQTQGWREKTLSVAGKEILIKAVAQAIPSYVMSCFELPKHICNEMHRLMARFWWGETIWRGRSKLCCPKNEGGLGFRNMYHFNLALLAKQGWRLIQNPNSIIARLLKEKYFPNCSFMEAEVKGGDSYTWRSIISGREVLKKGLQFQVGDGSGISVWKDPWIALPLSFKPFSPIMEGTEDFMVADLIDRENGEWLPYLLDELFTNGEVANIASIPLSLRCVEDRLIWHFDRRGIYNVKSGYCVFNKAQTALEMATSSMAVERGAWRQYWQMIWGANVPPKVRVFMWRLLKEILPTKSALAKKKIHIHDLRCMFCMGDVETGTHLFNPALLCFWLYGPLKLNALEHPATCIKEWTLDMLDELTNDHRDFFFVGLWAIWRERNKMVWNDAAFQPMFLIDWAVHFLKDYQKYHPKAVKKKKRPLTKWQCPPSGRLKINVDGAFRVDNSRGGIGVVVRNDAGTGIAALARPFLHAHSILNMEAEACRAGLLLGIHQGWSEIDIESDSAILIAALNSSKQDFSESVRIRHIYREANGVTDRLTHFASLFAIDDVCTGFRFYVPPLQNHTINIINETGREAKPPS
ncbi:uncharacterized protein LOC112171781 [Rosa chinensis]|uniref:uncharacterized protein LOC112171781 n=1 Tax=Rosa chinensis TaxID=74649 RepID=UPI000D089B68|nr:uncharacterized protein LOC112171781 [Rosa chinensis]